MKNASTRLVYDYWNRKRGDRLAPQRADINPTDIRHALSDTFMLAADFINQLRFRLAGTRVCALFGREIKGEAFAELWNDESHKMIEKQITIVTNEATGLVAGVTAHTEDGLTADLELLCCPSPISAMPEPVPLASWRHSCPPTGSAPHLLPILTLALCATSAPTPKVSPRGVSFRVSTASA